MSRSYVPRARTIRTRLLLFLALSVVITALAISLVTALLGFREGRERVVGQLKSVATLKENEIRDWADGLILNLDIVLSGSNVPGDLRTLAQAEGSAGSAMDLGAYYRVQEQFMWASNRMELFEELFFMDTEGTVLISTDPVHESQRLGFNDYFTEGLLGDFIQQPSYSLSLGKMTIVASTPVLDGGETLGVLAGRANLTGLNQILIERAGLGETGETYLVGSNHRLLTHLRRPGFAIPDTYIRTAGTDAAVDEGRSGSQTYESYSGAQVIGVYAWIPELKAALLAEQEESEALGATRGTLWIIGGVAALAVALAILAGIALTRRIVRPLARLGDTASRIAGGELGLRAEVVREDEIGSLAHTFNRMTGQLDELVKSLRRRTDHLRAINETGRRISSILDLDELLPYVAGSLRQTFDYDTVRILLLRDGEEGRLLTCAEPGCEAPTPLDLSDSDPLPGDALTEVLHTGKPVVPSPPDDSTTPGRASDERRAELAVPIRIGENLVGAIDIVAGTGDDLDEQDLFAARTLADQLAVAIENSRLYHQARELAASQERQRLARDLHDAVSQTLFSVSLIADVLPRIYERDPVQGAERLAELRQLTRGALAEMRTLLLELRPAALGDAKLADLLKQLGEAVTGRARIPVEVRIDGSDDLPTEVSVAFYRVAQEALNNVAKHSGAQTATVEMRSEGDPVKILRLNVRDDGSGFDPAHAGGGQLGMGIMRERAEAIGARLDVTSAPARGTTISVAWSAPNADPTGTSDL